ncbi:MAG: periplasmic heavy metal sensor [Nitrospirota bacterium]
MKDLLLLLLSLVIIVFVMNRIRLTRHKPIRGYLDLIELTEDQKRQVEEIRKGFLPEVAGVRQALRQKRLELSDLLFAEDPDMQAIEAKSMDISNLQRELEKKVIDHILQEKELLSSEQKKQFYAVIRNEFEGGGLGVHGERSNMRRKR